MFLCVHDATFSQSFPSAVFVALFCQNPPPLCLLDKQWSGLSLLFFILRGNISVKYCLNEYFVSGAVFRHSHTRKWYSGSLVTQQLYA